MSQWAHLFSQGVPHSGARVVFVGTASEFWVSRKGTLSRS